MWNRQKNKRTDGRTDKRWRFAWHACVCKIFHKSNEIHSYLLLSLIIVICSLVVRRGFLIRCTILMWYLRSYRQWPTWIANNWGIKLTNVTDVKRCGIVFMHTNPYWKTLKYSATMFTKTRRLIVYLFPTIPIATCTLYMDCD